VALAVDRYPGRFRIQLSQQIGLLFDLYVERIFRSRKCRHQKDEYITYILATFPNLCTVLPPSPPPIPPVLHLYSLVMPLFSNVKAFLANAIKEYCPDLNPLNIPTHPEDFLWYAERVNGRIAMLTITSVLMAEFATKESIFQIIGLFN
jgi:hypothetical protein